VTGVQTCALPIFKKENDEFIASEKEYGRSVTAKTFEEAKRNLIVSVLDYFDSLHANAMRFVKPAKVVSGESETIGTSRGFKK
jgi:hypothetical protein